jgi:hypothetical protein
MAKYKDNNLVKGSLCVTSKLRETDSYNLMGTIASISKHIQERKLELWNEIHSKGSKLSLVRPAYAKLKSEMKKDYPDLVEANFQKFLQHVTLRKAAKEKNDDIFGTSKSSFKKLS